MTGLSNEVTVVFVVGDGVRELQAKNVISIESVSLQGVDDYGGLQRGLEVSETENDFLTWLLFAGNETNSFEPQERPKDVRYLSLGGVERNAFDINCIRCVFGNW